MSTKTNSQNRSSQLRRAWQLYGGFKAVIRSRYFRLAILALLPTAHLWVSEDWWDVPIQILPNLLGFSLGGYAVLLTFGDDRFKELLARRMPVNDAEPQPANGSSDATEGGSLYMKVSATFLFFIIVQVAAVVTAVLAKSLSFDPRTGPLERLADTVWFQNAIAVLRFGGSLIGFFLFTYALFLAAAAAWAVFTLSDWFDRHLSRRSEK
jgi:hypothetical protein